MAGTARGSAVKIQSLGWLLPVLATVLLGACSQMVRWEDGPTRHSTLEPRPERYEVKAGDTLYSIAFRHHLDFRDVAQWNGLGGSYLIRPGQVLRLRPGQGNDAPAQEVVVRREVPMGAPQTSPVPSSTVATPRPIPNPEPPATSSRPTPKPTPAPTQRPQPTVASTPVAGWNWPVGGKLVKGFKPPESKGIDLAAEVGSPVKAAAAGRVVYSGTALKGYGQLIIIKHDDTHLSAYGYNRKRLVKEGDQVQAGQQIAEVGLGPAQQPMLHFEIRRRGQPVDPIRLLPKAG